MHIRLFGITKEITGETMITVPADAPVTTVHSLRQWLAGRYPGMQKLTSLAVAVNNEYAGDDTQLLPEYEIALIPPVSGG